MNAPLVSRIQQCPSLPSLPSIALQVLELAQKETVDIPEIARVISKDPALSSRILKTVNSSFYGRSQSVGTVSQALVVLGLQSVKTLVLGFSLVSNLTRTKTKGFKHLVYWRRSVYAATAARVLAGKLGVLQQEECFLAALLMDIGMLVLDQVLGEGYGEIAEKAATHNDLADLEMSALKMTHADVAAVLAEQWKLPPLLSVPMAWHHEPSVVPDGSLRKMAEVAWLAGRCADVFVDEQAAGALTEVRSFLQGRCQISEADCHAMLDDICNCTREVASLFEITVSSSLSFDAILKKASDALIDLTLRSQRQAATLEQDNQKLKREAETDALTGLANRAAFDRFLAEQLAAAVARGKPLSLLMMDLDHFKKVNDQYGHQAGDQVLRAMGKLLAAAARKTDLAARYGGEELVLVLPDTARPTAAAIAESLRRAVCARPVRHGDQTIPVSASIGVASFQPDTPLADTVRLLKAADMAVYAAKRAGRNCVRLFALKPGTSPRTAVA